MSGMPLRCVDGLPDRCSSRIDKAASFEIYWTVACMVGQLHRLLNIECKVSQGRFGVRFGLLVDMLVGIARGVARICLVRI